MPFANVGSDSIYYTEHGRALAGAPRAAPMLLVHGAAASHLVWGDAGARARRDHAHGRA